MYVQVMVIQYTKDPPPFLKFEGFLHIAKPVLCPPYFLFKEAINLNLHHYHFFLSNSVVPKICCNTKHCHIFLEQYYTRYMDMCVRVTRWLTTYMYMVKDKKRIFKKHRNFYTGFQQCRYAILLSLHDLTLRLEAGCSM